MQSVHPLRAYREQHGLSSAELAERIGVKRVTLWRWESGKRAIDRKLWTHVSAMTGIPQSELAGIEELPLPSIHQAAE